MKIFSWLGAPIEWLFDYEFYWWRRAERKPAQYQKSIEFNRDKRICEIKGWILVFLGLGTEFGYLGYGLMKNSGSYLILIAVTIVSIFLTEFGLIHLFAVRTRPKPKNQ
ncbi:MAG: hypothetical protein PHW15_03130 [Patescibacteria group bacterium]|jgi:hypothetical protein|nr:hypothetical protein [Patescibacteria group bacterium]MDD5173028.1 hypothetical protein [Patescibacteria group bacterium]